MGSASAGEAPTAQNNDEWGTGSSVPPTAGAAQTQDNDEWGVPSESASTSASAAPVDEWGTGGGGDARGNTSGSGW